MAAWDFADINTLIPHSHGITIIYNKISTEPASMFKLVGTSLPGISMCQLNCHRVYQ